MSTDKQALIREFQIEVEKVIPLGVERQDRHYQERGADLILQLDADLGIFRPAFALNIAYTDLERLAAEIAHERHHEWVYTCPICNTYAHK